MQTVYPQQVSTFSAKTTAFDNSTYPSTSLCDKNLARTSTPEIGHPRQFEEIIKLKSTVCPRTTLKALIISSLLVAFRWTPYPNAIFQHWPNKCSKYSTEKFFVKIEEGSSNRA
ncbi:hypothetical protein SprV_0301354500 [Sparganum proliferum]